MLFLDPGEVMKEGVLEYDSLVAGFDMTDTGEGNIDDVGVSNPSNEGNDAVSKDC